MARRRRRGTRAGQIRKTSRRAYRPTRRRARKSNPSPIGGYVRTDLVSGTLGAGVGIAATEIIDESWEGGQYAGFILAALGVWGARSLRGPMVKSFAAGFAIGSAGMTASNFLEQPTRRLLEPVISGLLPQGDD